MSHITHTKLHDSHMLFLIRFRIDILGVSHPQMVQSRPPTVTVARIYTVGQLDRETMSEYDLTVTAQDTTDHPLDGSAEVRISVLDSNDNAPEFEMDSFSFSVEEESVEGEGLIGSITVCSTHTLTLTLTHTTRTTHTHTHTGWTRLLMQMRAPMLPLTSLW